MLFMSKYLRVSRLDDLQYQFGDIFGGVGFPLGGDHIFLEAALGDVRVDQTDGDSVLC